MKSVRNFFHERMSSSDNSSNTNNPNQPQQSTKKDPFLRATSPPINPTNNNNSSSNNNDNCNPSSSSNGNTNMKTVSPTTVAAGNNIMKTPSPTSGSGTPSSPAPIPAAGIPSSPGATCISSPSSSTASLPPTGAASSGNTGSFKYRSSQRVHYQQQQQQEPPQSPVPTSSSQSITTTTTTEKGFSLFSSKSQKGRRKISLPWFRQNSVSAPHAALSRQHTIDSPGSFRFFRQASNTNNQVGSLEVTWVVSDYIATAGTNELTVSKGQQVEVVEISCSGDPDFCLVRLNPQTDDGAAQEGLVPVSILKPPPGSQKSGSRKDNDALQEQSNNRAKSDLLTSSSTKRRGFSGRKWLPQPLRKLSQGKVDKPPAERTLIKKGSEKSLGISEKQGENEENTTSTTTSANNNNSTGSGVVQSSSSQQQSQPDYEQEEEVALELPPPMKPIQEPNLIANAQPAYKDLKENSSNLANTFKKMEGNAPADLSEIEQIVKEKTEQHEVKSKFLKPLDVGGDSGKELEASYSNNDNANDINDENNTETNDVEAAQKKRMHALSELVTTEKDYIQDLSVIVNGYIAEIRNSNSDILIPEDLKSGKERMVFGNIEAIYEWHRDYFLKALQKCIETPSELGPMIKRYDRKLKMYIVYCQNKPVSEHIVTEHSNYFELIRQKLKHKLELNDLLIKPVQRITKYELLLKEITKQTEKAGLLDELPSMQEAAQVMKVVCKAVNDMMDVRRLQKFEGKISAQGMLLLRGPLLCIEENKNADKTANVVQKPRELQVFLFEQSIIFSEIVGKRTQFTSPSYVYRSHIQVNKMQLQELPNNRFLLKSTDPHRPDLVSFICSAVTPEQTREWVETIRNILQSQQDFLKAIQSPIQYVRELTKES